MQVRKIALVALASCMLSTTVAAQQPSITFDPTQMQACEGVKPEGTPWQLPNVGVARLIRDLPGMNAVEVAKLFRGPDASDILTKDQLKALAEDYMALRLAAAYHFQTPPGVDFKEAKQDPSDELWKRIEDATAPSALYSKVLPCGYMLQGGLTYGLRSSDGKFDFAVIKAPVYVWWSQKGVFTPDGKPGIRVWVSAPFDTPVDGMYRGAKAEIILPEICGNMTVGYALTETTEVSAPLPPVEKKPEPKPRLRDVPPPVPPPVIEEPEPETQAKKGSFPCTGKISRWVCPAIAGAAFALWPRNGNPTPTGNTTPGKTGDPGIR